MLFVFGRHSRRMATHVADCKWQRMHCTNNEKLKVLHVITTILKTSKIERLGFSLPLKVSIFRPNLVAFGKKNAGDIWELNVPFGP